MKFRIFDELKLLENYKNQFRISTDMDGRSEVAGSLIRQTINPK